MSCFSVLCIVFLLYERLKNFIPSYWRGVVQSGPSSHRAAGLWLATALPLTAERAVSAMGFERGNEGFKTRRQLRSLIQMNAFRNAEALATQRYDRDQMLSLVHEVT